MTLNAGTYSLAATSDFNPQATQTSTGNIFVNESSGNRISNVVSAVPELSAWALLIVSVVGASVLTLRRRQHAV